MVYEGFISIVGGALGFTIEPLFSKFFISWRMVLLPQAEIVLVDNIEFLSLGK